MYYGYYEQIEYKTLLKWCLIKHICVYVYQLAYIYIHQLHNKYFKSFWITNLY